MRKYLSYLVIALALLAPLSCARRHSRLIPKEKLSRIYAEMLITDQWIRASNMTRVADTSLVYEPIFEKYGYTSDDYRYTVGRYMEKEKAMTEVFDGAHEILKNRLDDLLSEERQKHVADSIRKVREKEYAHNKEFIHFTPYNFEEMDPYRGGLHFEWDTLSGSYKFTYRSVPFSFKGPMMTSTGNIPPDEYDEDEDVDDDIAEDEMMEADSLDVAADSLAASPVDSLMEVPEDSLPAKGKVPSKALPGKIDSLKHPTILKPDRKIKIEE